MLTLIDKIELWVLGAGIVVGLAMVGLAILLDLIRVAERVSHDADGLH